MNDKSQTLNNLSERLVYALEMTGTRKADLARAIDVKPQVIQFLCTSDTKASRFTFEIATALGLNTRWLATGEGAMFIADDPKYQLLKAYKQVPLLNSKQVREILEGKPLENAEPSEWVALKNGTNDTFAILMPDEAMESIIPANATIFICHNKNYQPNNGDIILAFVKQFNALIIRRFSIENDVAFLVPANNKTYKKSEYTEDMQIVGVITDCQFSLRR